MTEALLCVICSRPDQPRRATPGYLTDTTCSDRIVSTLDEIVAMYAQLPGIEPVAGNDGGRRGPGFGSRSPANDTIIALHDPRTTWTEDTRFHNPLNVVGGWARILLEETGSDAPIGSVHDAARFLARRIDWVTRQPWVDSLWTEVREVHSQLRSITGEGKRRYIAPCPNPLNADRADEELRYCGVRLFAPVYGDTIRCGSCEREWPRSEWMRLGNLVETG